MLRDKVKLFMRSTKKVLGVIIYLAVLATVVPGMAQVGQDSKGKEFWIAFTENKVSVLAYCLNFP